MHVSRLNPWGKDAGDFLFLLPQVAAAIVAAFVFYREKHDSRDRPQELLWGMFLGAGKPLGSESLLRFLRLSFNFSFEWKMRL